MAFSQQTLATIGAHSANTPAVWAYKSYDSINLISTSGYFDSKKNEFKIGDLIIIYTYDTAEMYLYKVTAVDPVEIEVVYFGATSDFDGLIRKENLVLYSEDFSDANWVKTSCTTVYHPEDGGFYRIDQNLGTATNFLHQINVPATNKYMTCVFRVRPINDNPISFKLFKLPATTEAEVEVLLPPNVWTDVVLKTDHKCTGVISVLVDNPNSFPNYKLDIKYIQAFETTDRWREVDALAVHPTRIFNSSMYVNGDSVMWHAYDGFTVYNHDRSTYSYQFAYKNNIEVDMQAKLAGQNISDLATTVNTDLDTNGAEKYYPIVMLNGGIVDAKDELRSAEDMLGFADSMIDDAKKVSENIYFFTIITSSPVLTTATKLGLAEDFNSLLIAKYEDDELVTIIDLNEVDGIENYWIDGSHLTYPAHDLIYEYISKRITLPNYITKYGYVISEGSAVNRIREPVGNEHLENLKKKQIDGETRWGKTTSDGKYVYWIVDVHEDTGVRIPMLRPTGNSFTPIVGGLRNWLYIIADTGRDPTLKLQEFTGAIGNYTIVVNRTTGLATITSVGGIKYDTPVEIAGELKTSNGRVVKTRRVTGTPDDVAVTDHTIFYNTDSNPITSNLVVAVENEGQSFRLINSGSSGNDLTVKDSGGTTIAVLSDNESLIITYNATDGWF